MTLPQGFESYFRRVWTEDSVDTLIRGLDEDVPVSIRLNPARMPSDAWPEGGESHVPWCPEGIYLAERPQFTADPLLHAGAYYVQEASSMFVAHVLRHLAPSQPPRGGESVPACSHEDMSAPPRGGWEGAFPQGAWEGAALDLCAAPGGKSTILRSLLPPDSLLISNEPLRQRAQVLAENLSKWGAGNVIVTQAYARDIARAARTCKTFPGFDLILADVPCSGEGMMRKEEEARRQWSPAFVAECAALQRSIIADIWPALRPGGYLIYSTCTFNPEEDEENVEWIARELGAEVVDIPVEPAWGILGDLRKGYTHSPLSPLPSPPRGGEHTLGNPIGNGLPPSGGLGGGYLSGGTGGGFPCYHFIPGRVRGEGFFCALLRKSSHECEDAGTADAFRPASLEEASIRTEHFDSATPSAVSHKQRKTGKNKHQKAAPKSIAEHLADELTTLPTTLLDSPGAPIVDLSLPDAIRYLQREALILPPDTPTGIVQVAYRGQRLGLMKNLGSRANNLYPKEWRIRSTFISPKSIFDKE